MNDRAAAPIGVFGFTPGGLRPLADCPHGVKPTDPGCQEISQRLRPPAFPFVISSGSADIAMNSSLSASA